MSPSQKHHLQRRDDFPESTIWIIIGALAGALVFLAIAMHLLRRFRLRHAEPPSFIPGNYLRNRWREWSPSAYTKLNAPGANGDSTRLGVRPSSDQTRDSSGRSAEIDRSQSVRSVVTLPPYRFAPLPSERLIAREGERAGVDTVIEFPQSEAEHEARREEEMQALYNIRETRRREQAERDERRRERQEARNAGDTRRVAQLEEESRARQRQREGSEASLVSTLRAAERGDIELTQPTSSHLIAELTSLREANAHSRRVSSVSYADLGLARHDGSRIRADSFESDHRPLLDSSASMGGRRSRATSRASSQGRSQSITSQGGRAVHVLSPDHTYQNGHNRQLSDGALSFVSTGSESPRSRAANFLTPQSSADVPPPDPPSYEDDISVHGGEAPPYEISFTQHASGLPAPSSSSQAMANVADGGGEEEIAAAAHLAQSYLSQVPGREEDERGAGPSSTSTTDMERIRESKTPSLAKLKTRPLVAPAIEVLSATPVNSVPTTPVEEHHGPRTTG